MRSNKHYSSQEFLGKGENLMFLKFKMKKILVLRVWTNYPQSSKWAKDDERTKEELTLI
ncbi:MAG: hypothetical protein CM15mP65_10070 [Crocinitomicaceae bacterium]|nr:MAG: hypothetical protein CM15mP65_10070 [Crocinitomicaceae bacterium]